MPVDILPSPASAEKIMGKPALNKAMLPSKFLAALPLSAVLSRLPRIAPPASLPHRSRFPGTLTALELRPLAFSRMGLAPRPA